MDISHIPLTVSTSLGELLRFLRRRARLSQRELSIAVGYSESHISRIENNERPVDRASLLALFVPAVEIENEPETIARLLALCEQAQPLPAVTPPAPGRDGTGAGGVTAGSGRACSHSARRRAGVSGSVSSSAPGAGRRKKRGRGNGGGGCCAGAGWGERWGSGT